MTADEVKRRFRERGETFTEWAKKHGYRRNEVYRVLNGAAKGHYGKAHEIAVRLGLKPACDEQGQQPSTARGGHAEAITRVRAQVSDVRLARAEAA